MIRPANHMYAVRLSELAGLLANGYERLLAQSRAGVKNDDQVPDLSTPLSLNSLDSSDLQRDVSNSPECSTQKQKVS